MKELEFPLLKIITPNKSLALKREHHQTEMTFSDTKMHWILRQLIHYILRHQSEYISFSLHKKIQQHSEFLNEYFLSSSLIAWYILHIFSTPHMGFLDKGFSFVLWLKQFLFKTSGPVHTIPSVSGHDSKTIWCWRGAFVFGVFWK